MPTATSSARVARSWPIGSSSGSRVAVVSNGRASGSTRVVRRSGGRAGTVIPARW